MNELIEETGPINPYARTFFWLWGLTVVLSLGFRNIDPAYRERLTQWHQQRLAALKSETGWLNLAGLFWLKEGVNTVGTDAAADLRFPTNNAPGKLGTFTLNGGQVSFAAAPEATITANGKPLAGNQAVFDVSQTKPVMLAQGSLRWFVIKRGDRYAIRLRDLNSPALTQFSGIERFPVDENLRVGARLELPVQPRTIPILDVTGQTTQQPLAGTLAFELGGKAYRLDAVGEGSDKLFVLFGDATNAQDTYGSGRFLYADRPDANGITTLDFNQSINPPCAFTPFATCPLPPKQNRLPIAIRAGEKRYGDH